MRKFNIFTLGLFAAATLLGSVSCGSKSKENIDDSSLTTGTEEVYDVNTPTDSIAKVFADAGKKSETPTDTTYAVTPSGIKYIVLKEGKGKSPTATDNVTVYYEGKLMNGFVFDSTDKNGGQPISFPLNQVIPGWTEGLQLMKEGGKAIFYIPSNLAYGSRALPGVPPNSDMIFTVELLKVN